MDYNDDVFGKSNIIIYTTEDGLSKIETTFDGDAVWLSIDQMAELFQRDKSTISRHIKNIYSEEELVQEATVAYFATVQNEGNRQVERSICYYNQLEVAIDSDWKFEITHKDDETKIRVMEYLKGLFALRQDM